MECFIMVVAHGRLANEFLATLDMLIGQQIDISAIDFMPGENLECLIKKLDKPVKAVDLAIPILFIVDMVSGSPFNACSFYVKNRKQTKLVAGANIPMLVNLLMDRDDVENIEELSEMAMTTGRNAIKNL
ncbi:mannose/fructose/sorbose PTS transporter subunit IIA [Acerihabitans sp. KWT182]|uniref:Mannose/fructose/sorbose PTS transporter subunit IIA n=1 Tax=Acerihabitans sp. KWT182 TaxID=3157919 RepID=A0AAU7QBN9_9GAMM